MTESTLPDAWRVDIIENEIGWIKKLDEVKYFDSEEKAKLFVKHYNNLHNRRVDAPDWYMMAEYVGKVQQRLLFPAKPV